MIKKILNYIKNWIWVEKFTETCESYKKDFVIRSGDRPEVAIEKLNSQYARGDIKPVLDRPEVVKNLWKERYEAKMKEKADLLVFGESSTEGYGEAFNPIIPVTPTPKGMLIDILKNAEKPTKAEEFELKWQIDQMINEL